MATSSRTRARVQIKKRVNNIILNSALHESYSINDLYGDSTWYQKKEDHHKDFKTGLKVTVLIPPVSLYTRLPNFSATAPYLSAEDSKAIRSNISAYNSKVEPAKAKLKSLTKQREAALAIKPRTSAVKKKIDSLNKQISTLEKSLGAGTGGLLAKYSTRYDITDFVTGLNWTSDITQGTVEASIILDNANGLFNYLPVGARVTIWRRKSLKNWTPGSEFNQRWYVYLQTYISDKVREADGRSHTMSLTCKDRFGYMGANDLPVKTYKKGRAHPKGWSPRDITINICKRAGLPYDEARIPKYVIQPNTKGFPNGVEWPRLETFTPSDANVAQALADAWNDSRKRLPEAKKRPYLIHSRRGNLEVEIVSPPGKWFEGVDFNTERLVPHYSDETSIESAQLTERITDEKWTVLKAKGKVVTRKKNPRTGKTEKKVKGVSGTFKANDIALQAFGERTKVQEFKQEFKSFAKFKEFCTDWINRNSRPDNNLEVKGKGVLGMWPLRYVYIESRYLGIRGYFMLKTITYEVSSGVFNVNMTVDVNKQHYVDGYRYYGKKRPIKPNSVDKWY